MSRFFQQIFAIKSQSRHKTEQMQKFWSPFFPEEQPQPFYGKLLARLAKFGWVPFADLRLWSLAIEWNAEFTESGWKLTSN